MVLTVTTYGSVTRSTMSLSLTNYHGKSINLGSFIKGYRDVHNLVGLHKSREWNLVTSK